MESAKANPDQLYAIVDYDIFDFSDPDDPVDVTLDNVSELTFQTDQAAFLAGYLAAGMTETGTVATYGGTLFPTVTIFMNGFAAGIRAYNQDNGTTVQLLGWDPTPVKQERAPSLARPDGRLRRLRRRTPGHGGLHQRGRRHHPAGCRTDGPRHDRSSGGRGRRVPDLGRPGRLRVACPTHAACSSRSIKKNMDVAVFDTMTVRHRGHVPRRPVRRARSRTAASSIAEFNDFDAAVPQELKDKLAELEQGIIDGSVSVSPKDYPA